MTSQKLSDLLPPLVFGTATFNYQFNLDPYALHPNDIVDRALAQGIRAFDTSPYYGPAEEILGEAIFRSTVHPAAKNVHVKRSDYFLLTKCGRIKADEFDYSPEWVRHSVRRSLKRLKTSYLDVVYCHDVEFVSPAEVLTAIRELRRIRDESGTVKYVGICGYPVDTLCSLAEMILRETGEPLDVVQSYANFTLQNQTLLTHGLERLVKAGVDVVPNASPLGMGLLRRQGPPIGAMGSWHPAPDGLREACLKAARWIEDRQSERLENVAVRFAMENWLREGAKVGSRGPVPQQVVSGQKPSVSTSYGAASTSLTVHERLGVSVMGVSNISELDETIRVYHSVIDGFADPLEDGYFNMQSNPQPAELTPSGDTVTDHKWSIQRRQRVRQFARAIREIIGQEWIDYAWPSPDPGFVNQRKVFGRVDDEIVDGPKPSAADLSTSPAAGPGHSGTGMPLTPPSGPDDNPVLETVPERQL